MVEKDIAKAAWPTKRKLIAYQQLVLARLGLNVGAIDGLIGPQTEFALSQHEYRIRYGVDLPLWRDALPDDDDEQALRATYGNPGENLVTVQVPYTLRLSWSPNVRVNRVTCNKKVSDSLLAVLEEVKEAYSPEEIRRHGFNLYGGCFNNRPKRGGSKLSTHAFGIALDFDPARNGLKSTDKTAYFAKPVCDEWWSIWEKHGWVSLGREQNFDWMHIQKATV